MNILAIETATEACSVAVLVAGSRGAKAPLPRTGADAAQEPANRDSHTAAQGSVGAARALARALLRRDSSPELFSFHEVAPRRHGELLLPAVERLLAEAGLTLDDMDAIAFGRGPGAFTGVRIAVAAAQGLAFGAGKPVIPVSTLAALAQGALDAGATSVWAAIDARMGEVYAAPFTADDAGLALADGDEWLGPLADLHVPDGYARVGTGFGQPELPAAAAVARIAAREFAAGRAVDADTAAPTYLRDTVTNL